MLIYDRAIGTYDMKGISAIEVLGRHLRTCNIAIIIHSGQVIVKILS